MVRIHPDPPLIGAVAQLGEHLLCKQGVVGSIPISSTSSAGSAEARSKPRRFACGFWRSLTKRKKQNAHDEVMSCVGLDCIDPCPHEFWGKG